MILEKETFKKFGYHSYDWNQQSHKRILAKCNRCGKIREITIQDYHDLCKSCVHIGKSHTEATKEKMREAHQGKHFSEEHKQKLCDARIGKYIGENNPMYGRHHSEKTKQKIRNSHQGEKCCNWQGGISFEPYCVKFNEEFKERVREYWNRRCVLCGKTEKENEQHLSIHHIDYNKEACCDDSFPLFISLCTSCHTKTNYNREYWKNKFKEIVYTRNINGKCFYTKEEMQLKIKEN